VEEKHGRGSHEKRREATKPLRECGTHGRTPREDAKMRRRIARGGMATMRQRDAPVATRLFTYV
jgi:hypothetical protein